VDCFFLFKHGHWTLDSVFKVSIGHLKAQQIMVLLITDS